MLVDVSGCTIDWFIDKTDIIDRMLFHGFNNFVDIHFSQKHMVVLENKDKGLRTEVHDIPDILGKAIALDSFDDRDGRILIILAV